MKTKALLTVLLLSLTMGVTACSGIASTPTNPSPTPWGNYADGLKASTAGR